MDHHRKFDETLLKYRYPRYDKQPTQDLVRVLRIPDTVHSGTGNICTIVSGISNFTVSAIPTVFNYVR